MCKKICIKWKEEKKKLPVGASKFFGNPHLWAGFVWPEYTDTDGERYCMDFICQINCAELALFDKEKKFPAKGILYFFYPLEDTPFSLRERDAVCYYYGGEVEKLDELVLAFDDGTMAGSKEQKIEFFVSEEARYPDHHLLGEPSIEPFDGDRIGLEDKILLFELYSFQTKDRRVQFWDDGTLQFYIRPDKLKAGETSGVEVRLNTT